MKQFILSILKVLGVYHPLQSAYRSRLFKIRRERLRKKYAPFQGGAMQCNACNARYERFESDLPLHEDAKAIEQYQIVAGYGENVFCPNCLSSARERLVLSYLQKWKLHNQSILHFSPEKNIYDYLKQHNNIQTADLYPGFYRSIDKNVQRQDITKLLYDSETFDIVIANHVLEHVPDDKKALNEIYRVLKHGGRAILQVPYSTIIEETIEQPDIKESHLQSELFGQRDHVRIYALNDYVRRLKAAGFIVDVIKDHFGENYAFQKDEVFFKISKAG